MQVVIGFDSVLVLKPDSEWIRVVFMAEVAAGALSSEVKHIPAGRIGDTGEKVSGLKVVCCTTGYASAV